MYKSTSTIALLQLLTWQGKTIGITQLDQSSPLVVVNVYGGDSHCCDDCDRCEDDEEPDHQPEPENHDDGNGTTGETDEEEGPDDDGEGNPDDNSEGDINSVCDHDINAQQTGWDGSPEQALAEELGWDYWDYTTDWNGLEPQDTRINEDYMVFIYDTICCWELNTSIDLMLTSGGFYLHELFEYQDQVSAQIGAAVMDAQTAALDRCAAQGEGWEQWDADRKEAEQFLPRDQCLHWDDAWWEDKSPQQELAEELNWDTTGFITDYNAVPPLDFLDTRIDDDFLVYVYGAACCRELNESIDMMLTSNGFYLHELFEMQETHLSARVWDAQAEALDACTAQGEGWEAWDVARQVEWQTRPVNRCLHWDNAWWEQKSDQQELAEDLGWGVVGFLADYLSDGGPVDVGIDEDFIEYIYGAACCEELEATRNHLLASHGFTQLSELRDFEESRHSAAITLAKDAAHAACGM